MSFSPQLSALAEYLAGEFDNRAQAIADPAWYVHVRMCVPSETRCCFTYNGNTIQVSLGFEATKNEFYSYDKGIDPETGKATWGALLGLYRYTKQNKL